METKDLERTLLQATQLSIARHALKQIMKETHMAMDGPLRTCFEVADDALQAMDTYGDS